MTTHTNYQASAHLLGQGDDLVVRSSHLEVSLSDLSPRLPNTLPCLSSSAWTSFRTSWRCRSAASGQWRVKSVAR